MPARFAPLPIDYRFGEKETTSILEELSHMGYIFVASTVSDEVAVTFPDGVLHKHFSMEAAVQDSMRHVSLLVSLAHQFIALDEAKLDVKDASKKLKDYSK